MEAVEYTRSRAWLVDVNNDGTKISLAVDYNVTDLDDKMRTEMLHQCLRALTELEFKLLQKRN